MGDYVVTLQTGFETVDLTWELSGDLLWILEALQEGEASRWGESSARL